MIVSPEPCSLDLLHYPDRIIITTTDEEISQISFSGSVLGYIFWMVLPPKTPRNATQNGANILLNV